MLDPQQHQQPDGSSLTQISVEDRLRRAAWAFTTRRVHGDFALVSDSSLAPRPGDLLLARVERLGFHTALQLPDGRRRRLFIGDEIVVAYGHRYAPNQFEAVVPKTLEPCQLVASGGVAAKVLSWHDSIAKQATQIRPLGLLADSDGRPARLSDFALPSLDPHRSVPPTIAVVGTSMDSGKTQSAAHLVKGLTRAGLRVGFAKITGTGSGGDTWLLKDAGADPVYDFTDAGLASTYMASQREVQNVFSTLIAHLTDSPADVIVLEIADGVLQGETSALLRSDTFRRVVAGVLFAANDAMGALSGRQWLRESGIPLLAVSGVLTAAPLAVREASKATGLPICSRQDLAHPSTATRILAAAKRAHASDADGRASVTERAAFSHVPAETDGNGSSTTPFDSTISRMELMR